MPHAFVHDIFLAKFRRDPAREAHLGPPVCERITSLDENVLDEASNA